METPKIQVYCTVGDDELTGTPAGLVCTRCRKTLVNLDDPAAVAAVKGVPSCGFIRRAAVPALAASLALSGCKSERSEGKYDGPVGKIKVECSPPEGGWPTAKAAENEPGKVISPHTGETVDVSKYRPGDLICDPSYHMRQGKYFRVPKPDADQQKPE